MDLGTIRTDGRCLWRENISAFNLYLIVLFIGLFLMGQMHPSPEQVEMIKNIRSITFIGIMLCIPFMLYELIRTWYKDIRTKIKKKTIIIIAVATILSILLSAFFKGGYIDTLLQANLMPVTILLVKPILRLFRIFI